MAKKIETCRQCGECCLNYPRTAYFCRMNGKDIEPSNRPPKDCPLERNRK